jgi:hypothetical protein
MLAVRRHDLSVYAGSRGGYFWLSASERHLRVTPALVKKNHLGLRIAITCFDSGRITPTPDEQSVGWSLQGQAMVSPPLTETLAIPLAEYDEWYVSETPRFERSVVEPFVNYGGFTLASPEVLVRDREARESDYDFLLPLQERFWRQLLAIKPESFIGWGDVNIVVSRRHDFVLAVYAA